MMFFRARTHASVLLSLSLSRIAAGQLPGEAGEVSTAGRGWQIPPCETPAPAPQAAPIADRVEGLRSLHVSPKCLMSSGEPSCCCDTSEAIGSQEQLCPVRLYSHL